MRLRAVLFVTLALSAGVSGYLQPRQAADRGVPQAGDQSQPSLFGFFGFPARTRLSRMNPQTLTPAGDPVPILEYHWHSSVSPNGSRIAAAIGSPSVGSVRIIDAASLEFVTARAGIAAEAVGWLDEQRVAAALACVPTNPGNYGWCRNLVLIDANSGDIIRRWPESDEDARRLLYEPPQGRSKPVAATRFGVAFLMGHVDMTTGAVLALVTPEEEVRWVFLERIEIGLVGPTEPNRRSRGPRTQAGLAVNPEGDHAFVVGAESEIAEVDLRTSAVTYHRVEGLPRLTGAFRRFAVWFGGRYLAVFGDILADGATANEPDGIRLIDTTTWQAQVVEPRGARAVVSDGWLIGYTPASIFGVSQTGARWTTGNDSVRLGTVLSLHAAGNRVLVSSRDEDMAFHTHAIDIATGRVLMSAPTDDGLVDLVAVR